MSNRVIICHLRQAYGTELSAETVSRITDAVLEEVKACTAPAAGAAFGALAAFAASSRAKGAWAGARPSTSSTPPILDGYADQVTQVIQKYLHV